MLRVEIGERMRHDGSAMRAPEPMEIERTVIELVEQRDIEALAICYLHAYSNPSHGEQTQEPVERRFPMLFLLTSVDISP